VFSAAASLHTQCTTAIPTAASFSSLLTPTTQQQHSYSSAQAAAAQPTLQEAAAALQAAGACLCVLPFEGPWKPWTFVFFVAFSV